MTRFGMEKVAILNFFCDSHLCASRSRVGSNFLFRRDDRTLGQYTKTRLFLTSTDRELGWTDARLHGLLKELFHDAVLEGVIADDDDPASGVDVIQGGEESLLESLQFGIHRDTQCLEDFRCGVLMR